jgi:hypothetical protein
MTVVARPTIKSSRMPTQKASGTSLPNAHNFVERACFCADTQVEREDREVARAHAVKARQEFEWRQPPWQQMMGVAALTGLRNG